MQDIFKNNLFLRNLQKIARVIKNEGLKGLVTRIKNIQNYRNINFKMMLHATEVAAFSPGSSSTCGFFLSNETDYHIHNASHKMPSIRWQNTPHTNPSRHGLLLTTGEKIVFPAQLIGKAFSLFICFGSGAISMSPVGLIIKVSIIERRKGDGVDPKLKTILSHHLNVQTSGSNWIEITKDLSDIEGSDGSLVVECNHAVSSFPAFDKIAIYELVLSKRSDLPLMRARAFRDIRIANELSHFATVYDHEIFNVNTYHQVNAIELSRTLLMKKLAILPPDFGLRLAQKADKKLIRVLSLCSGAARIESSYARSVKNPVHFTLFDLNEKLLDSAKSQFPDTCQVETVCGDINQISDFGKRFDIIICVSALHHVVELEKVCKFINDTLVSNGELWVIGEYIGRNGNRLWPEDYLIANEFFKKLPKKYRINNFRNKHVDVDLPDDDVSVNSFEGIRSQDIEACLELYFDELKALKFNCLLWRLIDLVYVDNYNIESEYDRRIIEMAVDLEINRFQSGGRPAELFGIYTLRHDMKSNLTDHIDEQL